MINFRDQDEMSHDLGGDITSRILNFSSLDEGEHYSKTLYLLALVG